VTKKELKSVNGMRGGEDPQGGQKGGEKQKKRKGGGDKQDIEGGWVIYVESNCREETAMALRLSQWKTTRG